MQDLDRAIESGGDGAVPRRIRGLEHARAGRIEAARADFDAALEDIPEDPGSFEHEFGMALRSAGAWEAAAHYLAAAARRRPGNEVLAMRAVTASLKAGRIETARAVMEAYLAQGTAVPRDTLAGGAALALLFEGPPMALLDPWLRRLESEPEWYGVLLQDVLGAAAVRAGRLDLALGRLRGAAAKNPTAWNLYFLAIAQAQSGRPEDARRFFAEGRDRAGEPDSRVIWESAVQLEILEAEIQRLLP
jgi:tetratricopeptide (TPR) repeat protein